MSAPIVKTRLRVISREAGHNTQLLLVSTDAEGVESSQDVTMALHVTGVRIGLKVGDVNRCSLECVAVGVEIDALVDDLAVTHIGHTRLRPRWLRRLQWRLTKWWWGVRRVDDVSTLSDRARRYAAR